jgi:S-methylmethionine-dependent homocysteine/selenocysteine methylase
VTTPTPPSSSLSNTDILQQYFANLRSYPRDVFLLDGGTGEELFRRNVPDDRKIWSATALVHSHYHDVLKDVHLTFLRNGSNAITTNSYGVVPGVGFTPNEISKYVALSGKIARTAVNQHVEEQQLQKQEKKNDDDQSKTIINPSSFVFGSVGPLVESYRPDLIKPHDEGVENYLRICTALQPYVDAFLAETMSCVSESLQVYDALKTIPASMGRPLLVSYTLNSNGDFRDSEPVCQGLRKLLKKVRDDQYDSTTNNDDNSITINSNNVVLLAIMFNCCEPEALSTALQRIRDDKELVRDLQDHQILLGGYANRLTAVDDQNWTLESSDAPQPFRSDLDEKVYWRKFVKQWIDDYNVQIVGGCCGITPEHIRYIHDEINKRSRN